MLVCWISLLNLSLYMSFLDKEIKWNKSKTVKGWYSVGTFEFSLTIAFYGRLSGNLERIGIELGQHSSHEEGSHLPNGYTHEVEESAPSDFGGGVTDPHQQLLIVLSNIGYCKDELSYELYDKYRHIWQHSRYIVIVNIYILRSPYYIFLFRAFLSWDI